MVEAHTQYNKRFGLIYRPDMDLKFISVYPRFGRDKYSKPSS